MKKKNLSKSIDLILAALFVMFGLFGQELKAEGGYQQTVTYKFIDENNLEQVGSLDLYIVAGGNSANLRDISCKDTYGLPILLRTGFMGMGKSYFFWKEGNTNQTLLCNSIGYKYGATDTITNRFPSMRSIYKDGLMYSPDGIVRASNLKPVKSNPSWNYQSSLSIVKCCNTLPCEEYGE